LQRQDTAREAERRYAEAVLYVVKRTNGSDRNRRCSEERCGGVVRLGRRRSTVAEQAAGRRCGRKRTRMLERQQQVSD
jgi:hypothetical protein